MLRFIMVEMKELDYVCPHSTVTDTLIQYNKQYSSSDIKSANDLSNCTSRFELGGVSKHEPAISLRISILYISIIVLITIHMVIKGEKIIHVE